MQVLDGSRCATTRAASAGSFLFHRRGTAGRPDEQNTLLTLFLPRGKMTEDSGYGQVVQQREGLRVHLARGRGRCVRSLLRHSGRWLPHLKRTARRVLDHQGPGLVGRLVRALAANAKIGPRESGGFFVSRRVHACGQPALPRSDADDPQAAPRAGDSDRTSPNCSESVSAREVIGRIR
jgi:hypothetical protein